MTITLTQISYAGWPNCYRLSNGIIDLIATTDVGPRIIRFGFTGQENEFAELPEVGQTGGSDWKSYGGHRLWHAPEHLPRTYFPDNAPVHIEEKGDFVRLVQPIEPTTGIQKEIDLMMAETAANVRVVHRLVNKNVWPVELAPWALSVMAPGGIGIAPLPPRGPHPLNILPASTLALWAYTNMADPRWIWGREFVLLRQDPAVADPQKVGMFTPDGWTAYGRNGRLFVKTFDPSQDKAHPDFNSNMEFFTNDAIFEVETLGPLVKLAPETAVTHTETWHLFSDVPQPESEADVRQFVLPKIRSLLSENTNP